MGKLLQLTLGSGDIVTVPLETSSTVTVRTRVQPDPSAYPIDEEHAYSDVVDAAVVDAPEPQPPAPVVEAPPTAVASPEPAPVVDVAPVAPQPDPQPQPQPEPEPQPAPVDQTLASPQDALMHADTLPLPDAAAHVAAALAKFPDDPDLRQAKVELDELVAAEADRPSGA